jgi:uncharacterized membrane protein
MPIVCPHCAAQMPDTAAYCPGCGQTMSSDLPAHGKVGVFSVRIAGGLAYVTFLPAAAFLVLAPYSRNRFVRFHSFQCLMFWAAALVIAMVLKVASLVLFIIPTLGPLLVVLTMMVLTLAVFVTWIVLVVKALQGYRFKLPLIGDLAEHQAGGA